MLTRFASGCEAAYIAEMASRPSNQTTRTAASATRPAQAVTGLALAAGIFGGWLALHCFAMFLFDLTWATLPLALILAAALCWLSVGLFIVSHDAMHGSLVPGGKRINSIIGASLLFLYAGFVWPRMREAHFDHHRHAGKAGDPDFDEHNPTSFWRWYGTFLSRYFGRGSVLFVSTVVTAYWLVLDVPATKIVLLYGAPAILSSLQLFYFGTYRPHTHAGAKFADRHNARSEDFGIAASLASCFHFGYHHEHHLAPYVPWWGLPKQRIRIANGGKTSAGRAKRVAVKGTELS